MFIIIPFLVWRFIDFMVAAIAPRFIPYLGSFAYPELLKEFHLPGFLTSFGNFDGVHYALIAQGGYYQNDQAFFPFFPLLMNVLSYLFPVRNAFFAPRNSILAGLLISNISFLIGLGVFAKYLDLLFPKNNTLRRSILISLLVFPTSFFFGAVYTEGLFFLLFISSLFFLKKKRYWLAGICAAIASSTRLIGVFIFLPFAVVLLKEKKLELKTLLLRTVRYLPVLIAPAAGFLAYAAYLWKTTGDPLLFFHAQPSFGANRSTHLIILPQVYYRYFKIFLTAQWNYQYFVSLVEITFFTFTMVVLLLDLIKNFRNNDRLGLSLFSFANIILPTLTGTFSSVPRYALFSLSIFLFISEMRSLRLKKALFLISVLFHVIFLSLFVQGYFIS